MYYILHGDDEFTLTEQVSKFREQMGDPQLADLSITQFDGRKLTLGELRHACDAIPFLTDKRLVIVEGMLARFDPRHQKNTDESGEETSEESNPSLAKELIQYLGQLPDTTRLVFSESKTLAKNNPVLKHAESDKGAHVKEFAVLAPRQLPKWIQERVKSKGGTIDERATDELAAHVGADLRLLDNEIDKLMTYRNNETLRVEDVRMMTASVRESDVFALVDALGQRKTDAALKLLHAQLDQNAAPAYLLTMIVRQFRLLLQMKDLAARGQTVDAARQQLKLHPFVAEKTWQQALNFTLPQLEAIYRKLLETDLATKTGRSEPSVALDMLVVELTR